MSARDLAEWNSADRVLPAVLRLAPTRAGGFVWRSGCEPLNDLLSVVAAVSAATHLIQYAPKGKREALSERPHLTLGSPWNPAAATGRSDQR